MPLGKGPGAAYARLLQARLHTPGFNSHKYLVTEEKGTMNDRFLNPDKKFLCRRSRQKKKVKDRFIWAKHVQMTLQASVSEAGKGAGEKSHV